MYKVYEYLMVPGTINNTLTIMGYSTIIGKTYLVQLTGPAR